MNDRAKDDDTDHTPWITIAGEHEERGHGRAHECAEERDDRHRTGEDAERQPVRHSQRSEPDRGEHREDHHAQQLSGDPGAQVTCDLEQDVAHQLTLGRREECDQPLAIVRRTTREIQCHHHQREPVDREMQQAEHLGQQPFQL